MNKLPILILLSLQLAASSQNAHAEFCAVKLLVTLGDGTPVGSAIADLIDPRGSVVQTSTIANGKGEFCDFGFGYYSIRIGQESVIPTTLSGVRLIYGKTQQLRITLNSMPGSGSGGGGGNACQAYIRLTSEDGKPTPGVRVSYRGIVRESDDFGRVLLLVPVKEFASFRFEKGGFRPVDVSIGCSTWDDVMERKVVLPPAQH